MPSTVEQLSPSRVKMTVEVPFAELKPALDKAYRDIASQVNIPGFRAGKVPPMIIDQRFGRGMVLQEAINATLPELYGRAIQENKLVPLTEPEVEVTKVEDDDVFEFVAELDVRPDFEVPAFDSISVQIDTVSVDDEQLEKQIEVLRQRFGTMQDVERAAAEGDVVTLNLQGSKNGEELEDLAAEGVTYKLGSGGMLEGLDEAVTGLSADESAEFNSELVGGPMRGEKVDIKATVTKVQQQELPEVDDEFAQLVSEFDTVEEMREDLRESLIGAARLEQAGAARDKVLEAIVEEINLELPESVIQNEIKSRHDQITGQLNQAGLTLDQYLEDGDTDQTAEEFWAEVDDRSVMALKAQLVLDKVAEEREIGVDQNDLTEHLMRKAQESGSSPEQEAQHMMEHNHMAEWMGEIRRAKALAIMVDSANVTDSEGNDLNLKALQPDGTMAEATEEGSENEDSEDEATADVDEATEDSLAEVQGKQEFYDGLGDDSEVSESADVESASKDKADDAK